MSDSQYPQQPDPQRGDPQQGWEQPGAQPAPYPPVQPVAPPTSGRATTSLVLGIGGLVMCGLFLGIPAMIVSRQAKREIAASNGTVGGEGLATAGFVTGLIGTIWSVLGGILLVVLIVVGGRVATEIDQHCVTTHDADGNPHLVCN